MKRITMRMMKTMKRNERKILYCLDVFVVVFIY